MAVTAVVARASVWRGAVLAVVVGVAALGAAEPATAGRGGSDGARERDLVYRVRDLTYRSRAVDNSERTEESGEATTVILSADVLFEFDRADLTPAAQSRLDQLAGELDELGPRTVSIAGHTDAMGEPAYNQDLSQRRADAVHVALDERLGDGFSFEVSGHGEDQPIAANENEDGSDNPEGRALNRRVEIQYPTG